MVFLFPVIGNCESALSEKPDNIYFHAVIPERRFEPIPNSLSSDLASSDNFLFPRMKKELGGRHFYSDDNVFVAVDQFLKA